MMIVEEEEIISLILKIFSVVVFNTHTLYDEPPTTQHSIDNENVSNPPHNFFQNFITRVLQ